MGGCSSDAYDVLCERGYSGVTSTGACYDVYLLYMGARTHTSGKSSARGYGTNWGDFNAGLQAHSNLIGKGLLPGSADRVDPELQDLIEVPSFYESVEGGNVLTQREQFDAIYQYFSTVFQRQDAFQHTTQHTAVAFSAAEVEQAAGTPSDLSEMVMDLHEQCRYSIRHNKHTGQFPMQLGVRQGCSLSPLLFATFTGFFYEALRERTDATWAAAFVTLFADDTMLQWHIESETRHRTKDGFVLRLGTPTQKMEPGDQAMAEQARREAAEVFGAPAMETGDKSRRESTEGLEDWAGRKPKWNRPASKGQQSYGKGHSGGSWKDPKDPWSYEPAQLGEQEQEFLRNVAKMLMRHESEMRLLRQDTTWMMFVDTQEQGVLSLIQEKSAKWQELYQEKKVTSSLRTVLLIGVFQELATRLQALLQDQDRLNKMHSVGWLVSGEQALNPKWVYQQWSPEKQTVEVSSQAPILYSLALDAIQAVINNVGGPGVLLRFRSTRPLTEKITGEVMPFALVLSMRGQLAMQVHQALGILSGCACLKVAGLRVRPDRGQQSTLAKALEDSYTGLSFADWKPRDRKWQRQQSHWTQEGQAMAFAWTGQLVDREDRCYGNATAAVKPVLANGKPHLPQSLAWHMLLGALDAPILLDLTGATVAEVPLPAQVYLEALEENLLLAAYKLLKIEEAGCYPPASLSIAQRNDILAFARSDLAPERYERLALYAAQLCEKLPYEPGAGLPPPVDDNVEQGSYANQVASQLLHDSSASLWGAARQVVAQLNFKAERRLSTGLPQTVVRLGAYGHHSFCGLTQVMAAPRMVVEESGLHAWTEAQ
ncbi:unnamed protein product, partial [Symbiodinium sp. KB8]